MISIYALINPINDSVFYVGATQFPESRLQGHHSNCNGKTRKDEMIRIIKSFGLKAEILVLDEVQDEETRFWEEFYIELFSSYGFNMLQKKFSNYPLTTYNYQPPYFRQESENINGLDTYVISGCCNGEDIKYTLSQKTSKLTYTELKDRLYEMYESRVSFIKAQNKHKDLLAD